MTKLNVISGGRADTWQSSFMDLEPIIFDVCRMIELAVMMHDDNQKDLEAFCIHEARDKTEALKRKYREL